MVNPDAAIDIAFIRAKDVVINHSRGRRHADVLVGLFVLLNGVTGQDHALLKSSGTNVSTSGIGGVIMITSVIWAFVRKAGVYAGRVPAGAKPAEMAIEPPTRFEPVINLKSAQALGLTIPPSVLGRADEVIE